MKYRAGDTAHSTAAGQAPVAAALQDAAGRTWSSYGAFADAAGAPICQPSSADRPLEAESALVLAEHAAIGRGTVIAVSWRPVNPTAIERAAFAQGREAMQQSWIETPEQLTSHLAVLQVVPPSTQRE